MIDMSLDSVRSIICEATGLSPAQVTLQLKMGDYPQWDSVAHIGLMLLLEKRLNIAIDEPTIIQCTTISGILDLFD